MLHNFIQSGAARVFRPLVLFLVLALPALLVFHDVRRIPGLYWATSIGLLWLFILSLHQSSRTARLAGAGLALLFAVLNVALSISFQIQGSAFNAAFFAHLDTTTLQIALKTDGVRMAAAALYVLAVPFVAYWACARPYFTGSLGPVAPVIGRIALLGAAIGTSYPISSIVLHYRNTAQASERLLAEIADLQARSASTMTTSLDQPRNLVVLYLEGLEANYLDAEIFPDLTPNLTRLAEEGLWFRDMRPFPGTKWTIGGVVSSHCGVPLLSARHTNMVLTEVDNPFDSITCLPEYLGSAGYRTAFLGGASLKFAGKGDFLRKNGYDLALGLDELPNSTAHDWGMFDDQLFQQAKTLFDGMVETGDPFLFTALTLDTHHPHGTPSPSCAAYADKWQTMINAVHCSDQLVQDFISHVQASPVGDETVIAVISDHLLLMGDTEDALATKDRRLLFFLLDPTRPGESFTGAATHFDIAPTMLDALGFSGAQFAFGHSLLSHDEGRVFERRLSERDLQPFTIEQLLAKSDKTVVD